MAATDHQTHSVYLRSQWSNAWTEVENLYAESFVEASSPDVSSARLYWRYGDVLRYGKKQFATESFKDILGQYVRITVGGREWVGVLVGDQRDLDGGFDSGRPSGVQVISALGLEYLLMRKTLSAAMVEKGADAIEIPRAIGFNLGPGREGDVEFFPNRSAAVGPDGVYVFSESLPGDEWTARQIIEYLLYYYAPSDSAGDIQIPWKLDPLGNLDRFDTKTPVLQAEGRTVKQLLDVLIDRRRLHGYKVDTLTLSNPQIHVFSFAQNDINLAGGATVPKNANQTDWDFSEDARAQSAVVVRDQTASYERVIARGERRGACFSLAEADDTLEKDWDTTIEPDYNTASSADAGYAALSLVAKRDANAAFRDDEKFARVFRFFKVPDDFSGYVHSDRVAFGAVIGDLSTGLFGAPPDIWPAGMTLGSTLPLFAEVDYTDPAQVATIGRERLRPFATIKLDGRHYRLDRLSEGNSYSVGIAGGGRRWAASLRMQRDRMGVILDVQGAPQHTIAGADFAELSVDTWPAEADWRDVQVTVFATLDHWAEASYPAPTPAPAGDIEKVLILRVPGARIDHLALGTIIGVDEAGELIESVDGYLRDDTALLEDAAKIAYQWYSRERRKLTVRTHTLDPALEVGHLLNKIGKAGEANEEEVNSVVTQIKYDLRAGAHLLETEYAEIDVRGL